MNYKEQLLSNEWRSKRTEILKRDNYCCQKCKRKNPPFDNLSKSYGLLSMKDLSKRGYELLKSQPVLILNKDGKEIKPLFIGKDDIFNFETLKFAAQRTEILILGVKEFYNQLVYFFDTEDFAEIIDLHVHHKYYQISKKAWEYNDRALITLCSDCHRIEHETNSIMVYDDSFIKLNEATICNRCSGSGYLSKYSYYEQGICFQCYGEGVIISN